MPSRTEGLGAPRSVFKDSEQLRFPIEMVLLLLGLGFVRIELEPAKVREKDFLADPHANRNPLTLGRDVAGANRDDLPEARLFLKRVGEMKRTKHGHSMLAPHKDPIKQRPKAKGSLEKREREAAENKPRARQWNGGHQQDTADQQPTVRRHEDGTRRGTKQG